MKYKLFLFDLDDTLLSFRKTEEFSFFYLMKEFGVKKNRVELLEIYRKESAKLWALFEQGAITKDFLKVERFKKTCELGELNLDHKELGELYLERLPQELHYEDQALEVCRAVSKSATIGIVTNGIDSVQRMRIKSAGLAGFTSFIVTSEQCGCAKPNVNFFKFTMEKFGKKFSKKDTLVIGDKLEADIKGAQSYGLDSCWYNPLGKKASFKNINPTYRINHLNEVLKWLS